MNNFYVQVCINGMVMDYLVMAKTAEDAEKLVRRSVLFIDTIVVETFETVLAREKPPQLLLNFLYEQENDNAN